MFVRVRLPCVRTYVRTLTVISMDELFFTGSCCYPSVLPLRSKSVNYNLFQVLYRIYEGERRRAKKRGKEIRDRISSTNFPPDSSSRGVVGGDFQLLVGYQNFPAAVYFSRVHFNYLRESYRYAYVRTRSTIYVLA